MKVEENEQEGEIDNKNTCIHVDEEKEQDEMLKAP